MQKEIRFHSTYNAIVIHFMESMSQAAEVMKSISSRHLPVVDDQGSIVGILSDRDMSRAAGLEHAVVRDSMSWPVAVIEEEQSVALAAQLMIDQKISSLILTRDGLAVGIVTTEDLLRILLVDEKSLMQIFKEKVISTVYNFPLGGIAQNLSDSGL